MFGRKIRLVIEKEEKPTVDYKPVRYVSLSKAIKLGLV